MAVVEGKTDRAALLPHFGSNAVVKLADSKEKLLAAYDELEPRLRDRVLFIVDCDGGLQPSLRGHVDLIISQNRDLEADLILSAGAFDRVALALLSEQAESIPWILEHAKVAVERSAYAASLMGVVLQNARDLGLSTRVVVPKKGIKRVVSIVDLDPGRVHFEDPEPLVIAQVADDFGSLLQWGLSDVNAVIDRAMSEWGESCPAHGRVCIDCQAWRSANGHHLVDSLCSYLKNVLGVEVSAKELTRSISLGVSDLSSWPVIDRIRTWEMASGAQLLIERNE